jgi:hypothetical protein
MSQARWLCRLSGIVRCCPTAWVVGLAALVSSAGVYLLVFQPFDKTPEKHSSPERSTELDFSEPETEVPEGLAIVPFGKRHHFPEIRKPWYVTTKEVDNTPGEDEPILGLVVGKEARAFSTNQLNEHEMVIDEIGGVPVLVTY